MTHYSIPYRYRHCKINDKTKKIYSVVFCTAFLILVVYLFYYIGF